MAGACFVFFDVFLVLLAVFFPPLPVFIKAGVCSADALCFLGYLPGVLHSWYIIAKYPEVVELDIERQDLNPRGYFVRPVYISVSQSPPCEHEQGHAHSHEDNASHSFGQGRGSNDDSRYGTIPQGPPPEYSECRK